MGLINIAGPIKLMLVMRFGANFNIPKDHLLPKDGGEIDICLVLLFSQCISCHKIRTGHKA